MGTFFSSLLGFNGTSKPADDTEIIYNNPPMNEYNYLNNGVYVDFEQPNKVFYPVIPVSDMDKEPYV